MLLAVEINLLKNVKQHLDSQSTLHIQNRKFIQALMIVSCLLGHKRTNLAKGYDRKKF